MNWCAVLLDVCCSIGKTDHRRSEKVSFFHFGIGANDTIDKETGWTLKTLASLIAFCNDENVSFELILSSCNFVSYCISTVES